MTTNKLEITAGHILSSIIFLIVCVLWVFVTHGNTIREIETDVGILDNNLARLEESIKEKGVCE